MTCQVLLLGARGAGKSTAIAALRARRLEDAPTGHPDPAIERHMASVGTAKDLVIGEPASTSRADSTWPALSDRYDGALLLINHNAAERTRELERCLSRLRGASDPVRPLVIGVTHLDQLPQLPLSAYDDYIQQTNHGCGCGRCTPPVLALDARSPTDVRAALVTLDAIIEMARRYPQPPCRA